MRRLQSVRLHWWLGRRLLRAPGQRWALSALALTSTLSALLILGLSAVPDVLHDRQDAEAARTVTDTGKSTGVAALTSTWDWRGEQPIHLLRIGVEAESMANAAHLPGVPQPPMPDEVWLSPQLAQDLARDPVLRKAFPQRVVGTIDESVLPTSQDRVAYVGVDPKSLTERGIHATQSIGADAAEFQTSSRTLILLGGATLALFVGVPLAAVFVAAFGLLAQPRQRQVRLLEALGAKPRRARVLVCADGIVAGLLGTAVAWLLFETLSRAITHIPFTPAQWTAGHPDIKFTGALLSLLTPLAAAVWAAWRLDARVTNGRLLSRRAGPHLSTIPLPPLFAAIGLIAVLASARVRADSSPLATAAVVTAVALSALSAPATIAWAQRAIGMALLRSTRLNATTLIAGARLARDLHLQPDFHGNRSPRANPTLRGAISGLTLSATADDLALQYLAAVQAVAYGTRHILEAMNKKGYAIDTLLACGGGTKNPVFLREHADITGCRVVLPKEPEAVLLGSAVLGAVASGQFAGVLPAMAAMNAADRVIAPTKGPVTRYHAAKYKVFHRLHADFLAYRKLMHQN